MTSPQALAWTKKKFSLTGDIGAKSSRRDLRKTVNGRPIIHEKAMQGNCQDAVREAAVMWERSSSDRDEADLLEEVVAANRQFADCCVKMPR